MNQAYCNYCKAYIPKTKTCLLNYKQNTKHRKHTLPELQTPYPAENCPRPLTKTDLFIILSSSEQAAANE
jgi:hypothetical protein